jgi:ring-1,2-phenylacetyl-CoA epoxidase subunit PaaC
MGHDSPYEGLDESTASDGRWAFGTGFEDPLAGVDTALAPGVDGDAMAAYCLMLGDDALVLSHRLQEWITLLPELEEEVAIANVALDLLGQARMLLARAGRADGTERGEDDLAFSRPLGEMRNCLLVEQIDEDFAHLVVRLLIFSTWRLALFEALRGSTDQVLAAIAAKSCNEVAYHRDFAAQWVVRLGDGTEESARRTAAAVDALWPFVDELFETHPSVERLDTVAVDPRLLRPAFDAVMAEVFEAATVAWPARPGHGLTGRDGQHTHAMGELLDEMQSIARALPGANW